MSDSSGISWHAPDSAQKIPSTLVSENLSDVTGPIVREIPSVSNIKSFEALPPAAKARETKKAADIFASNGENVFVHYVSPVLHKRRELLLSTGVNRKKYTKTAAQLWSALAAEESLFWNGAAREIRQCMKQGVLSTKDCLLHAGIQSEKASYLRHAELAIAMYLNLPPPQHESVVLEDTPGPTLMEVGYDTGDKLDARANCSLGAGLENVTTLALDALSISVGEQTVTLATLPVMTEATFTENDPTVFSIQDQKEKNEIALLDTLPMRFGYEQNMLYSHFAHYDYDKVRKVEGKHQTAMLRQLAALFDKTGKVLFHYYIVPHLCKKVSPPSNGDTVTSKAVDLWRFLPGRQKEKWWSESSQLKKQLGNGDLAGLETLQLDSLDPEVLKLHGLAEEVLQEYQME